MGSKSTHQMPTISTLEPTDVFYVVREVSPGVFRDYSCPRSLLPESTYVATTLITSAEILDLFDTPIRLVPAQGAGVLILVKLVTMYAANGTLAYVGGVKIGGTTIDSNNFVIDTVLPDLENPFPYRVIYPNNAGGNFSQGMEPNMALRIIGDGSNPTTGDGDVLVKVYYQLING